MDAEVRVAERRQLRDGVALVRGRVGVGRAREQRDRPLALVAAEVAEPGRELAQRSGQLAAGAHAAPVEELLGLLKRRLGALLGRRVGLRRRGRGRSAGQGQKEGCRQGSLEHAATSQHLVGCLGRGPLAEWELDDLGGRALDVHRVPRGGLAPDQGEGDRAVGGGHAGGADPAHLALAERDRLPVLGRAGSA